MSEVASRLCQACGLCCDGSLFSTVRLQPGDLAPALKQLGLRIQYKKRYNFFDQPCVAFKKQCCSIYQARPERCRVFECQQIQRLARGEASEEMVLKKINEAQSKIAVIKKFLYRLGPTNPKKPLLQQYEQIAAEPVHCSSEQNIVEERAELDKALLNLNEFLDQEFRCP